MPSKTSAGLLMFRKRAGILEVLLVHPGGPFWRNKDAGAWSIPKGEAAENEDFLSRAKTEFEEEVGIPAAGPFLELGQVKQKGGKIVHAWACEGELPDNFEHRSNTFEVEWPPRSGQREQFQEIDRVGFFSMNEASNKINAAQREFLNRLAGLIGERNERGL